MSKYTVSLSPHVRLNTSTRQIMLDVILALLPCCLAAVYFFGCQPLILLAVGIISAVITEALWCKLVKKKQTVQDFSAFLTGMMLALNLPGGAPWWLAAVGSVFAVLVVKQFFGGLGQNFLNPALAARAFLLASWPARMTSYPVPLVDAVTSATPLASIYGKFADALAPLMDLFTGNVPGVMGEVCKAAILLGAAYLFIRGIISPAIPFTFIGVVFALSALFGPQGPSLQTGLYAIASGGLLFGAFFMATDYVTTPLTVRGQLLFAVGCGVITFVIRRFGAYPEGTTYAILLMNVATPLIDRWVYPRRYGKAADKT